MFVPSCFSQIHHHIKQALMLYSYNYWAASDNKLVSMFLSQSSATYKCEKSEVRTKEPNSAEDSVKEGNSTTRTCTPEVTSLVCCTPVHGLLLLFMVI